MSDANKWEGRLNEALRDLADFLDGKANPGDHINDYLTDIALIRLAMICGMPLDCFDREWPEPMGFHNRMVEAWKKSSDGAFRAVLDEFTFRHLVAGQDLLDVLLNGKVVDGADAGAIEGTMH